MQTITKTAAAKRSTARTTRAERLVRELRGVDATEMRDRVQSARAMTAEQLVERRQAERRARAEKAAAALRAA